MQPNWCGSAQVFGLKPHRFCGHAVAISTVPLQLIWRPRCIAACSRPWIRCFQCRIHASTDRFPRLSVSCPIRVSKGVQGIWMRLPLGTDTQLVAFQRRNLPTLFMFFRPCGERKVGAVVGPVRSASSRPHGTWVSPKAPNSGSTLLSLSQTLGSSLANTPGVGAGPCTLESQSFDHFFHMARVCVDPQPSGTPSCCRLLRSSAFSFSHPFVNCWITQRLPWRP